MIEVRLSIPLSRWMEDLKDRRARDRVLARLRRFELGNFGDARPVGSGVSEARMGYGLGYRLYFARQTDVVVVMLGGGDKAHRKRDIGIAKAMAKEL